MSVQLINRPIIISKKIKKNGGGEREINGVNQHITTTLNLVQKKQKTKALRSQEQLAIICNCWEMEFFFLYSNLEFHHTSETKMLK